MTTFVKAAQWTSEPAKATQFYPLSAKSGTPFQHFKQDLGGWVQKSGNSRNSGKSARVTMLSIPNQNTDSTKSMSNRILILSLVSLLLHACAQQPPKPQPLPPPQKEPKPEISQPSPPVQPPEVTIQPGPAIAGREDVQAFISEMARKHGFSAAELRKTFSNVSIQQPILTAMSKPWEAKPWYAYKKLFLTDTRIQNGIAFKQRNAQALARAEAKYGVSPDIITAIIGIESAYGAKPGNYRVIDTLSTLGFDYPKRAGFFRGELEQFLLLSREEGMSPLQPIGSYAGAMGMPQFMPSSYRKLAADGDGDGKRDIWNNPADAIASVARYFSANGWKTGEPIARSIDGPDSASGKVVKLEEENGPAYWATYHNFNVIMRYNHSPLYAMAAYELSRRFAPGQ
ncbi:membrane-bound lytic murein transglycosylase B [Planctomycetaceae bacterium]|nr:membrane-bound lytic murein transglycosylase B [Planctomycetaceae bacterium]